MRFFLIEAVVLTVIVLAVAAVVFRSSRAANALRTLRRVGFIYVIVLVAAGILAGVQRNF